MGKQQPSQRGKKHLRQKQDGHFGLENFAQRRGHVRALEEFHKRRTRKRVDTARALKSYRKAMRQEGFEAGTGASRKRSPANARSCDAVVDTKDETSVGTSSDCENTKSRKRHKSNPFLKPLQQAETKKQDSEKEKTKKEENEAQRRKRLQERRLQSKLLTKRTRKGQPIMKHMVDNVLTKLQKRGV